jgi:hypothetical protein
LKSGIDLTECECDYECELDKKNEIITQQQKEIELLKAKISELENTIIPKETKTIDKIIKRKNKKIISKTTINFDDKIILAFD